MFKKKSLTIFVLIFNVLLISCSTNKLSTERITYFNEFGEIISKAKYNKKLKKLFHFGIENEETKEYRLINRSQKGKTEISNQLIETFKSEYDLHLDEDKLIVVLYFSDNKKVENYDLYKKEFMKKWYAELEINLNEIGTNEVLYIHKSKLNFDQYNVVNLIPDPAGIIESEFFIHEFGDSFVVISPNGEFISYYGEFAKEQVWEACGKLNKT